MQGVPEETFDHGVGNPRVQVAGRGGNWLTSIRIGAGAPEEPPRHGAKNPRVRVSGWIFEVG